MIHRAWISQTEWATEEAYLSAEVWDGPQKIDDWMSYDDSWDDEEDDTNLVEDTMRPPPEQPPYGFNSP